MEVLACTLLADGSSDRVLQPILGWLLDEHCPCPYAIEYAPIHRGSLDRRIAQAMKDFPCDLMFVHRDAEGADPMERQTEIESAWRVASGDGHLVAVIPVRMTECWLLFDEAAIRRAADNPNGAVTLGLPRMSRVEQLPDPKGVLFDALRRASGLPPQRLQRYRPEAGRVRVTELVTDGNFEPLRALPAFQRLEAQVRAVFKH